MILQCSPLMIAFCGNTNFLGLAVRSIVILIAGNSKFERLGAAHRNIYKVKKENATRRSLFLNPL